MKKILAILSSLSLISTSALTAVACHVESEDEDQISPEKLKVLNAVQEVVDEGVEYNGDFFFNYETKDEQEKEFQRAFLYNYDLEGLSFFHGLLTGLIKEELDKKLGSEYLKNTFPNFALNVKFLNFSENSLSNEFEKILENKELELNYLVQINFNTFEDMDIIENIWIKNDGTFKFEKIKKDKKGFRFFTLTGLYSEHIIVKKDKKNLWPIFKFKQGNYIESDQDKIDFYIKYYSKKFYGKIFNSDLNIVSLSFFPDLFFNGHYRKLFDIPKDIVNLIKANPNNEEYEDKILKYLDNAIKKLHSARDIDEVNYQQNFVKGIRFNEVKLVEAYTKNEILDNSDLLKAFGDPNWQIRPFNGILIYDIDFNLTNNEIISSNSHKERIFIFSLER